MSTQAVEDFTEAAEMVGLVGSHIHDAPRLNTLRISCSAASPRARNANRFYLAAKLLENTGTPVASGPSPFTPELDEASFTGCSCELVSLGSKGPDDPRPKVSLIDFWSDYPGTAPEWTFLRGQMMPSEKAPTRHVGAFEFHSGKPHHGLTFEEMVMGFGLTVHRPHTRELTKPSKAFRAFTELREWLSLTVAEAAELVGVKRTTPNAWERDGREPRPSSARRLYQLHSIVRAVVNTLGEDAAMRWLEQGKPSPRKMLVQGNIEAASRSAERLLVRVRDVPGPSPGSLLEEPKGRPTTPRASTRRRGRRRRQGPRS